MSWSKRKRELELESEPENKQPGINVLFNYINLEEVEYENLEKDVLYLIDDYSESDQSFRHIIGKYDKEITSPYGTQNLVFKDTFRCIKTYGRVTGISKIGFDNIYRFQKDPTNVKVYKCPTELETMFWRHYVNKDIPTHIFHKIHYVDQFDECGICGYNLDNTQGPNYPDVNDICGERCNDVIYMCENKHMSHRSCALKCLDLGQVNVREQMGIGEDQLGFDSSNENWDSERSGTCPFCTLPITRESIMKAHKITFKQNHENKKASSSSPPTKKRGGKRSKRVRRRTYKRRYRL